MKQVFLVDGNSFVYRAFFATPYLSNFQGDADECHPAFINMLRKLINEKKPDGLVVVWDSKAPVIQGPDCPRTTRRRGLPCPAI